MATRTLLTHLHRRRAVLQALGPLRLPPLHDDDHDHDDHDDDHDDHDDGRAPALVLRVAAGHLVRYSSNDTLRAARQALSMLTLLARIDVAAWYGEVTTLWPHVELQPLIEFISHHPREIVMGLQFEFDITANVELLDRLREDDFSPVLRALLVGMEALPQDAILPVVPVGLTLGRREMEQSNRLRVSWFHTHGIEFMREVLAKILAIVIPQSSPVTPGHRPEMQLKVDALGFSNQEFRIEARGIEMLGQLVECGVHVQDVPAIVDVHHQLEVMNTIDNYRVARGLRALLDTTDNWLSNTRYGVRQLTISTSRHTDQEHALFSAIQQSQSLRSIAVEDSGSRDELDLAHISRLLDYVALALFSRRTTHHIRRLELNLPHLEMENVTSMHKAILAQDNSHLLSDRQLTLVVICPTWVIGTWFYVGQWSTDQQAPWSIAYRTDSPIDVLVVGQREGARGMWLEVKLPRCETAWIRREDATLLEDPGQSNPDREPKFVGTFETVALHGLTKQSMRANLSLLCLCGYTIRRLEVHGVVYAADDDHDDWLRQVPTICPNLEELQVLSSCLRRLTPLLDGLRSRKRPLRRLKIDGVRSPDDLYDFFGALCDPTHPLACQVEELDMYLGTISKKTTFSVIQKVVQATKHLRVLRLRARVQTRAYTTADKGARSLFSFDRDAPPTTHVSQLEPHCKIAFMSVVCTGLIAERAVGRLNHEALASIFEYAGHFCTRSMTLAFA